MRLAVIIALLALAGPAVAADGSTLFDAHCSDCHTVSAAESGPIGPSLKGVAGRSRASLPDFDYSPALKGKPGAWTDADLDAFINSPQDFAPGSKMFVGDADPVERAAIIAYLKTGK